jgi:multidrug efflux pump subunit AcrA (membrane-fusion protein)
MFVRVRVLCGERERCIRIPSACLVRRDGSRGSIYRLVNGRVFAQELELGEEEAGEVLVRGGLEEGERIVHSPSPLLQEGEKVDAIEHTQPTRSP